MSEHRYLIVGGRSEAGQSALAAIRTYSANGGPAAHVIATSSGAAELEGFEQTLTGIDLNAAEATDRIVAALAGAPIDVLFFAPAFGPVGYPISAATLPDAREALRFSFDPLRSLGDRLRPRLSVGYSAFYWLPHTLAGYGAMAYAKLALDALAYAEPARYRAIRAGTFFSQATRGIGLLLQRQLRNTPYAELQALGDKFRESGKKFPEFFFEYAFAAEQANFGARFAAPHRPTTRDDLTRATYAILTGQITTPVVGVIGDWLWGETESPALGPEFTLRADVLRALGLPG